MLHAEVFAMRMNDAARMLTGSIVVYAIMAACSAANMSRGFGGDDGGAGSSASSGGTGASSGGGLADALTDPVSSANADPYQSGTRLKANYLAGSDGSKQWAGWHDAQRNEDCGFVTAADGTTRCMPTDSTVASYYADPNCAQPLALVVCNAKTATYVRAPIGASAPSPAAGMHIFPLAGAVTPSTAYAVTPMTADAGTCSGLTYSCAAVAASSWSLSLSYQTAYSVGPEIPRACSSKQRCRWSRKARWSLQPRASPGQKHGRRAGG
jgi:hypothetical protein